MQSYEKCMLCGRACGVNRAHGAVGYCKKGSRLSLARAALHFWEEPPISGTRGSGAIFFSGCSLGCVYCQNEKISHGGVGEEIENETLAALCLSLQEQGAHNINFVTPTHYMPTVREAILSARALGLSVPTVYNTSGYDDAEALSMMHGVVNVYLPDFKYIREDISARYSMAKNYPSVAKAALSEMVRQCPTPIFDNGGLLKSGVLVRVLVLPGAVANAKLTLRYLHDTYGNQILYSIMRQYTPRAGLASPLCRRVTEAEYDEVLSYALRIGITDAYTQSAESATDAYTPPFETLEGIR